MLTSVSIRNYQSLHDISLELKPFTVIVGPSSSGKSAFTRALKTLTSNQRGESFITHGETQTVIKASTERGTVALMRGKKNEYVIIPDGDTSEQKVFTKLAGATPEEVSEFIGIPAKDPLNYANQFDMPYLLTSSAAEVARTLGDLTNVSVIFEASREANRQRLQASSTLKTRARDYEALTQNLDQYRNLKSNEAALNAAEEILQQARETQTRISSLEAVVSRIVEVPEVPHLDLPDVTELEEKLLRMQKLEFLISTYDRLTEQIKTHRQEAEQFKKLSESKQEEYNQALRDAGTCPTCGSDTSHVHLST